MAIAVRRTPREALHVALSKLRAPLAVSSRSNTVVIKPSIYDPNTVGNTSPVMIRAVVDLFVGSALVKIVESDNPIRTADEAFKTAGYESLNTEGVELVNLSKSPSARAAMPGFFHGEHPMPSLLLNSPFLVNVATAKFEPDICTIGAGIKNLFGLLPESNKDRYHEDINPILIDLLAAFRPDLTILDLTEVVVGPRANGITKHVGGVIVSTDPVAADAYCANLLGLEPLDIPYLKIAHDNGLGEAIIDRIRVLGTKNQIELLANLMKDSQVQH